MGTCSILKNWWLSPKGQAKILLHSDLLAGPFSSRGTCLTSGNGGFGCLWTFLYFALIPASLEFLKSVKVKA